MFLYHPFNFIKQFKDKTDIKIKIFYYSLEMDLESKLIAGIGKRLYEENRLIVPPSVLLSMNKKNRLSDDIYRKILEAEKYFDDIQEYVIMSDAQQNPTGIYKQLWKYAADNGKFIYKIIDEKDPITGAETRVQKIDHYIPNNPNEYVIIITDHLAELTTERGWDIKQTIEKHSDYMRIIRNTFGYIPVDVQQQSAAQENLERFKANKLEPSLEGFGESKLTARKANIILGLFSPAIHELQNYRGYNIGRLQDNYRNLSIIRQRNGESGINVGLYFNGACNYFQELPRASDMTEEHYLRIEKNR